MKVILKKDMSNLGEAGDVVDVKPGYARNYLLPQDIAYLASAENIARLEEEQKEREDRKKREFLEARRRASQLSGQSFTFLAKAGEEGKLFGSVTSADIVERINAEAGLDFELDRRTIDLSEPLKELGEFQVDIRLHSDVVESVGVVIAREDA
jgi:large subunit ribosomal protein L9